jgi:hypothetical protein
MKRTKTIPIRIIDYEFPTDWPCLYIVPIFDAQIGDPGFDQVALEGYRDWILEHENAMTVLGGDNLNTTTKHNRTDDLWESNLKPQQAINLGAKIFKPLKNRILGVVDGNHEDRAFRDTGLSPTIEMLLKIGFSDPEIERIYDPRVLILRLRFGHNSSQGKRWSYTGYLTHGWGGARKSGGQVNKSEEMGLVINNCDFYMIGHEHTLKANPVTVGYVPSTGNFCQEQRQIYALCGGFCHYTRFQKKIARRLPDIGAPRIRLEGIQGHRGRKDIHISV